MAVRLLVGPPTALAFAGARQIACGAADLSQVAQATLNNTDSTADREALEGIKRHLDAVVASAMALKRAVLMLGREKDDLTRIINE